MKPASLALIVAKILPLVVVFSLFRHTYPMFSLTFALFFAFFGPRLEATAPLVKLGQNIKAQGVSKSGKSLVLAVGRQDGIILGDEGVLHSEKLGESYDATVMKSYPSKSYWSLKKRINKKGISRLKLGLGLWVLRGHRKRKDLYKVTVNSKRPSGEKELGLVTQEKVFSDDLDRFVWEDEKKIAETKKVTPKTKAYIRRFSRTSKKSQRMREASAIEGLGPVDDGDIRPKDNYLTTKEINEFTPDVEDEDSLLRSRPLPGETLKASNLRLARREARLQKQRWPVELFFRGSFSLIPRESVDTESSGPQARSYSLGPGIELHGGKASKALQWLGIEVSAEFGDSYWPDQGNGTRFLERRIRVVANFYPSTKVSETQKLIPVVGLGLSYGRAKMRPVGSNDSFDFEHWSLPIVQAGLKFRYKGLGRFAGPLAGSSWGWHMLFSYERPSLVSIDNSLLDDFSERISDNDIRFILGANIFF